MPSAITQSIGTAAVNALPATQASANRRETSASTQSAAQLAQSTQAVAQRQTTDLKATGKERSPSIQKRPEGSASREDGERKKASETEAESEQGRESNSNLDVVA